MDFDTAQPTVNQPEPLPPTLLPTPVPISPIQPPSPQLSSQESITTPIKKFPILLIILLILIFSVGLGYGAFYFLELSKDTDTGKTVKLPVPTKAIVPTTVLEQSTVTPAASSSEAPFGYIIKDTLCYSITVPTSNNAGSENSCDLSYSASINTPKNNSLLVGAGINSELKDYISSQDMADKWLVAYQKNNPENKEITKGLTKVGGVDAYFLLIKDAISDLETQYTFIYIPEKYKVRNSSVSGFSIIQTFSDPENADIAKQETEKLFYSWLWK